MRPRHVAAAVVADSENHRIRRIDHNGTISTFYAGP
jgi:hypothetical protein